MIPNNYQNVILVGLIILAFSYVIINSRDIISIEIPFFPIYILSILTMYVSYIIMIFNKSKKVFGTGLIIGGGMLFYHFFDIMILLLSKGDETFIDILPGMITHVLPEMWHFHIPGFVLIALGIVYLLKSTHLKNKKMTS